jgi:peptidoglycan/LPS O-acetylase OafA/YrhL
MLKPPPTPADAPMADSGAAPKLREIPAVGAARDSAAPVRMRLDFLDGMRGIAALAVFLAHALDLIWPAYHNFAEARFQLGNWGVVVFFLCSGFIIPISLERQGSLRRFWIRRLLRLYPLYWLSVVLCMLCALAGVSAFARAIITRPLGVFATNLTMFQAFFGYPYLNTVYWSLTVEMLFYLAVSALFARRLLRNTVPITAILLGITTTVELLAPATIGLIYLLPLALIFVGTIFYRIQQGTLGWAPAAGVLALAVVMLMAPLFGSRAALAEQLPWFAAQISALGFFSAVFLLRRRRTSPFVLYLGRISYSLYLLHTVVIAVIPAVGGPVVTLLVWTGALLIIASATYRWVEQPAIAWGQRLTRE